ncbi:NACHT domain-containing protein [Streptomyces olivaceus]|uniref:NACHT domain-containing protein n=1 Tax=Streptomyces olivaceus TaxID=47716 RepID=UPI003644BFF9
MSDDGDKTAAGRDRMAAFAAELRALHVAAGSPSSRNLAHKIGTLSHSTIAAALSGRTVPRWPVVKTVVEALGGDTALFNQLWTAAAAEMRDAPTGEERRDEEFLSRYRRYVVNQYGDLRVTGLGYLDKRHSADLFVPPMITDVAEMGGDAEQISLKQFQKRIDKTVVLGEPGIGKSVLCRFLVHQWATRGEGAFLVCIRELARRSAPPLLVTEFIEQELTSALQSRPPEGLVERLLLRGPAFVIFDGLDEVADDEEARRIGTMISAFASQYPLAHVLVTSRPAEYDRFPLDPGIFSQFTINKFNARQVEEFIHRWFAGQIGDAEIQESRAEKLRQQIRKHPETGESPLLLTLTCAITLFRAEPPRNTQELFSLYWEMLVDRDSVKRVHDKNPPEVPRRADALGSVALAVVRDETTEQDRQGYNFHHQTLAEYSAMRYLASESETPEVLADKYLRLEPLAQHEDIVSQIADERWFSGGFRFAEALRERSEQREVRSFRTQNELEAHMEGWRVSPDVPPAVTEVLRATRYIVAHSLHQPRLRPAAIVMGWAAVEGGLRELVSGSDLVAAAESEGILTPDGARKLRVLRDARDLITHSGKAAWEIGELVEIIGGLHEVASAVYEDQRRPPGFVEQPAEFRGPGRQLPA